MTGGNYIRGLSFFSRTVFLLSSLRLDPSDGAQVAEVCFLGAFLLLLLLLLFESFWIFLVVTSRVLSFFREGLNRFAVIGRHRNCFFYGCCYIGPFFFFFFFFQFGSFVTRLTY